MSFKRINREALNIEKWTSCIQTNERYRLYSQVWFLDLVCHSDWDILVWDDYRAVFPLPISGKFGISFLQNPNLLQQIDIYGSVSDIERKQFEEYLSSTYKFIALSTSRKLLRFNTFIKRTNLYLKTEQYLQLKPSSTLRNNLKKAAKQNLSLKIESNYKRGLVFLKEHFHLTGHNPDDNEWGFYEQIMEKAYDLKKAKFIFVLKNNKPVQFSFWIVEEGFAYYLLNISSPEGRLCGASHFAIHQFIQENKSSIHCVDFEGSSIEGVKRFYKTFGAKEEYYYLSRQNNLPFFLKWFKK